MYKGRNGNERLKLHIADHTVILVTDGFKCLRCLKGVKRRKQRFSMSVGIGCADIVLNALGFSRHRVVHMAIKNFVKLKNIVRCQGDDIKALMNNVQHVAVSGNLLLIAVSGRGLLAHQLTDTGARGHDALNGIGCLGALYLCDLNKLFKLLGAPFQIQFLLSDFLVNSSN